MENLVLEYIIVGLWWDHFLKHPLSGLILRDALFLRIIVNEMWRKWTLGEKHTWKKHMSFFTFECNVFVSIIDFLMYQPGGFLFVMWLNRIDQIYSWRFMSLFVHFQKSKQRRHVIGWKRQDSHSMPNCTRVRNTIHIYNHTHADLSRTHLLIRLPQQMGLQLCG